MHETPEVRIETGPPMLVAGLRRQHAMANAAGSVPAQWNEFRERGVSGLRGAVPLRVLGAYCSMSRDGFEYLTGVEVTSFDDLPPDMGRMRIPPQTYAVFTHTGNVRGVGSTWQYIWNEWLPNSTYEDGETPPFELFDERFDPDTGEGVFEIWLPVRATRDGQ